MSLFNFQRIVLFLRKNVIEDRKKLRSVCDVINKQFSFLLDIKPLGISRFCRINKKKEEVFPFIKIMISHVQQLLHIFR